MFQNIFITPKRNLLPTRSHPTSLHLPPPQHFSVTMDLCNLLSVPMDLYMLGISYKWSHVVCDLSFQAPLTWYNVLRFHSCYRCVSTSFLFMTEQYFITWEYINNTLCLSIYKLVNIWIVSVFWLLWVLLLWTFLYKFLCEHMFSAVLWIYLQVELLDLIVTLCLTFWGTAKLFLNNFSTTRFQFSHILASAWYCLFFIHSHSSGMVSPWGFDLHFPNGWWCWTSFQDFMIALMMACLLQCLRSSPLLLLCWLYRTCVLV